MKKTENTQNRFWKYIRSLTEPPPNITDIRQRHQARLLLALLLIIIIMGGLSGTIQLLTIPGFFTTFVAILGAVVVLGFAYFLARKKYYLYAAMLTVLTPFLASYAALLENTEDQSAFVFMLISVLLSSMLLNRWLTLSVALLNLLGLVLLPVIQPAWTFAIVSGKFSFHIIISALVLIALWHRDLIERDRQKELAQSELKFRSIFDHSVDAIGVSMNGVHIMVNPAYVGMFGCDSADNLVGTSILDLIAPSERAKIQENIRRRLSGDEMPAMYETRGLRSDGTEFDMEVHVSTYELDGKLYTVPILRDITERKKAEEALRASEEAYKLLFESNPQPLWVYDTNSLAFLAVNDEAVSRYGYSKEDFLGMTIKDIRPKADIPRLMDNIANLSGGLDHAGNWQHIKKDGSLIDVEVTSHFLIFEGKQAELVISNDITARKAAEKALWKSELLYRAIVEGTTDLICRFLPDTTLTFVNEAYCAYFGKSREQLIGFRFLGLIPENDWAGVRSHVNHLIQTRKPVTYSHKVISPSGEIRWQQWTDSIILNDDGHIVELQSVGRDITEGKQMEEALRDSHNLLRTVLDTIPIRIFWKDTNLRYLGCNQPFAVDAGVHVSDEIIGKDDYQMGWRQQAELYRSDDRKVLESGIPKFNYEEPQTTPDGRFIWLRTSKVPLRDSGGEIRGVLGTYEDITERKQIEQERETLIAELESKNAELERFTYTVSHDLKSPLVTIKGFLGFIQQDIVSGNRERLNKDIERIGDATKKMEKLLWDLLELSRIGRLVRPSEEIPFNDLVNEAMEIVHGQLVSRKVMVDIHPDLPNVFGDRQRLIEVLQNLLDNAAKYMGDQAKPIVEIGLRGMVDEKYVLYVRDNGIGIPPQHHERVFGLFNKLDPSSEGTGVGLALVKRIIEFHGGQIWIESEGNNQGTTVCFTLQVSKQFQETGER